VSNVESSQITTRHTASVPSPTLVPTNVLDFMRGFAAVYVVINHVRGNFFKGGGRTIAEATDPLGLYDYASIALLQLTALGTDCAHLAALHGGHHFCGHRVLAVCPI